MDHRLEQLSLLFVDVLIRRVACVSALGSVVGDIGHFPQASSNSWSSDTDPRIVGLSPEQFPAVARYQCEIPDGDLKEGISMVDLTQR